MNIEVLTTEILNSGKSWEQIREKIESIDSLLNNKNSKEYAIGKIFEVFSKLYFMAEPSVKDDYKNVWLYNEIPTEIKDLLDLTDIEYGVDLLLEDFEGKYTAVQCKYRKNENSILSWSKDKLANLFGFCPKANYYMVFTNVSGVDDVTKNRYKNDFTLYSIQDLLNIKHETFRNMINILNGDKSRETKKYIPREYQKEAINKSIQYFAHNDRGQLILPCGTGKTLIALWIKESLKSTNTIVLVPSLTLLRQVKNQWSEQKNIFYRYICVCSEKDIDDNKNDYIIIHAYEIGGRVTNNIDDIKDFLCKKEDKVIFCTYQSLHLIEEALAGISFTFDLAICDEAHRTAGTVDKEFGLIHNNDKIPVKKRLYMTATPRVVKESLRKRLGEDIKYLFDMNDPKVFGKQMYYMSFKNAIENNILVDYKIIAIGISDDDIRKFIIDRRYISKNETLNEIANNYALDIVMNKYNASHAITFHSKLSSALKFFERHKLLFNDIKSYYICGVYASNKRSIILRDFKNADKAVISNSRCLTEGIDVPSIDMVFFCNPKDSKIDIVQAVGRALRKDKKNENKIGYIVIPLFHRESSEIENAIEKSVYNNLIKIIRSLCDEDDRLQDEITNVIYNKGKFINGKFQVMTDRNNKDNILTLIGFEDKLKESLFDDIIQKTSNGWDLMFLKVKEFVEQNGNFPTNKDLYNDENKQIYRWINHQRVLKKSNQLSNKRIMQLDSIGFIWDVFDKLWIDKLKLYTEFLRLNNKNMLSINSNNSIERELAYWAINMRHARKENKLLDEQIKLLDSIGFQWTRKGHNKFNSCNKLNLLIEYRKANPDKWPPQRSKDPIEHTLAVWFLSIRKKYRNNKLNNKLMNDLRNLGFPFEPSDQRWIKTYNVLKKWITAHNCFPSAKNQVKKEFDLYNWCKRQKMKYLNNELSDEYKTLLNEINFYQFIEDKHDIWDDNFQNVKKYYDKEGKLPAYTANKDKHILSLGRWCSKQRKDYKEGLLSKEQIVKLQSINIIFDAAKENKEKWELMFNQFKSFKEESKKEWPSPNIKNGQKELYIWCNNQKLLYKNKLMTQERIDKLNSIGFPFGYIRKDNWNKKYEELKKFLYENPEKIIPSLINGNHNPLYNWIEHQKIMYKEGRLSKDKIEKLKSIGAL